MNDYKNDKQIKEKMQSLDTLSGGIVFGKEDAWERLQARMEQKPAKKFPVKYWMAAAAILLLFVSVTTVYYYPSKEVVKNNNGKIKTPINNIAIAQPKIIPVMQQREMPIQKIVATGEHSTRVNAFLKNRKAEQTEINNMPLVQAPVSEIKEEQDKPMTVITAATANTQKKMKVIYIGDLERNTPTQTTAQLAANPAAIGISKVKTMHINDIERQERETEQMLQGDKLTVGQRFFFKPVLYNDHKQSEEYPEPQNPLKSILNIQN